MTRTRKDIEAGDRTSLRAQVRAITLATAAISSSAAALTACGDDPFPATPIGPTDAGADVREASLPPVDDGGGAPGEPDADAGRPTYDASDEPVLCATTPCVTQVAAGERHFCALINDGTVRCWGTDTRGSLGRELDGAAPGTDPQPVAGLTNAKQISAGALGKTTCAVVDDGHVWCWGDNSGAQLGLAPSPPETYVRDNQPHPIPTQVALVDQIVRVDVGQENACALRADGKVYCWGGNDSYELARPGTSGFYQPVGLAELGDHPIARLVLTQNSSFAITKTGQLLGWGRPSGRQTSLPSTEGSPFPVLLPSLDDVTRAATSGASGSNEHQCAIASGSVYCWGTTVRGELGTGVPDKEQIPAFAGIVTDAGVFPQGLALGPHRSCVRMTNGTVQCCGDDRLGQLGRGGDAGTFANVFGPAVAVTGHVVQVASSANATCALLQGGKVVCWGGNANGELGQGTTDTDPHPTPVEVVFP